MNSIEELQQSLSQLTNTVAEEKAQVLDAISGLQSVVAELEQKLANGVDLSAAIAQVKAIQAEVAGIYSDETTVDEPEEESDTEEE